jgi:thiamine-phosphate pyrophosphorylase
MLFYAITDRRMLADEEEQRRKILIGHARKWARGGIDFIQIREKDLDLPELLALSRQLIEVVQEEAGSSGRRPRVLLNGPPEIALAAGADGVHLLANAPPGSAAAAHAIYTESGRQALVSQSCHATEEAAHSQASLILFAPVFEKSLSPEAALPGRGLSALAEACQAAASTPVFALGGVTAQHAQACIQAGAKGIAAIRLFLNDDWQQLRNRAL